MRKATYGTIAAAAAAGVLLITVLTIHQSRLATASVESQATSNIVDVRVLEKSIDAKTLPDGNVKGGYGEEED